MNTDSHWVGLHLLPMFCSCYCASPLWQLKTHGSVEDNNTTSTATPTMTRNVKDTEANSS